MAVKNSLRVPYNVLENWDINSVDLCSWRMVTSTPDGYVSALGLPSQSVSGTLSPGIGNLSNLQSMLLQNNAISGPIPSTISKLEKLQALDLSSNNFNASLIWAYLQSYEFCGSVGKTHRFESNEDYECHRGAED